MRRGASTGDDLTGPFQREETRRQDVVYAVIQDGDIAVTPGIARSVDDARAADQDVDRRGTHNATARRATISWRVVAAASAAESGSTPMPGPVGTLNVLSSLSAKSGPATSWA
jgi:hypothetical protein